MESALRAENTAEVHFPGELHEAVQQKRVVQGQIGWPLVQVWPVIENASFGHRVPVTRCEGAASVGLAGDRIGD